MFNAKNSYILESIENVYINELKYYVMENFINLDKTNESYLKFDQEIINDLFGEDYTYLQLIVERTYQDYLENKDKCYSYDENGEVISIDKEDGAVTSREFLVKAIIYPYFCIRIIDYEKVAYYTENNLTLSFEYMDHLFNTIYNVYKGCGDASINAEKVIYPILAALDEKSFNDFYLYANALLLAYTDSKTGKYDKRDIFAKELCYDLINIYRIIYIIDHYKKTKDDKQIAEQEVLVEEKTTKKRKSRARKNLNE